MSQSINVPKLGTTMTEAILVEWIAEDGASIAAGDPICRIESDKVDEEIYSPGAGILRIRADEGETYQVGELLAEIE